MGKGLFITATGTNVGKSILSLGIMLWALKAGIKVAYYKPIQCGKFPFPIRQNGSKYGSDNASNKNGGNKIGSHIEGGDKEWLADASPLPFPVFGTYDFRKAASPHLAAEEEGVRVDMQKLSRDYHALLNDFQLVVIEGAGGVAVPINRKGETITDMLKLFGAPSLMACSPGLGTLNHTLLSHFFLSQHGCNPLGFIMCHPQNEISTLFPDNVRTIREFTAMEYFGEMPFVEALEAKSALPAESIETLIDGISDGLGNWWEKSA